jgi:2-keto-3-deoxy-L-rhamnonate aldolase RhmA
MDEHRPPPSGTASARLLDRLWAGELTLMLGIRGSRTMDIVGIAHSTGHQCILVDLQHSTMSIDVAAALCAAAGSRGMTALVRIPEREYGLIGRVLDGGAHGIIAPRIETAEEARIVARACRFPPRGQRSQTPQVPQFGMRPTPAADLNPALNGSVVVQMLLETPAGVANADAIASVDGVDMLAIGANDFTTELGVPGRFDDPRIKGAVATVADACRRHRKLLMVAGILDESIYESLVPLGICPLVLTGMDTTLLYQAAAAGADRAIARNAAMRRHIVRG